MQHVKMANISNASKSAVSTKWKNALAPEPVPMNVTWALLVSSMKSYPLNAIPTVTVSEW
jgi:hypothetical protein